MNGDFRFLFIQKYEIEIHLKNNITKILNYKILLICKFCENKVKMKKINIIKIKKTHRKTRNKSKYRYNILNNDRAIAFRAIFFEKS